MKLFILAIEYLIGISLVTPNKPIRFHLIVYNLSKVDPLNFSAIRELFGNTIDDNYQVN